MHALPDEPRDREPARTNVPALRGGPTQALAGGNNGGGPRNEMVKLFAKRAPETLWNRKLLILFLLIASASVTYVGASKLSKSSYEVEATLLYSPLPVPEDGKSLYIPPDLKTLASLINSPSVIDKVREEFKIALTTKLMDKSLTITIPGGTKAVKLALKWDDEAQAPLVLNRWTEVFIHHVATLRRAQLADHIKDFEGNLRNVQARLEAAIGEVRAFHRREGLVDFKTDVDNALKLIGEYELALSQLKRSESETIAQDQRLARHLEDVKKEEQKEVEREKQYEAANESISDARRRQDRLRELIDEKRRVQEIQAMIDAKKMEAELQVRKLAVRGVASKEELEKIEAEVSVYVSRINEGDQIKAWRAELEKIDKTVIPDGAKKSQGSPIIQQTLYHKLELELHLIGIRDQIEQIHRGMKARRDMLSRLDRLRNEYESLNRKVETIDAERAKVEGLIAMMRNLQNLKAGEFVVATAAEVPKFVATSNKKVLIAGFCSGGLALSLLVVAGVEWFAATWSCEVRACQLGLPPLGWVEPSGRPYHRQQLRGLALRLRQFMPEPGAVVVFSTLSEPGQADETIHELASLLALRDERVLVLDARIGIEPATDASSVAVPAASDAPSLSAGPSASWPVDVFRLPNPPEAPAPGLTDYLAFVTNDLDEICQAAGEFGVDLISVGRTEIPSDTLATHRMAELVAALRERYSILLVFAPLSHAVDLQILAAMAHGIIAVVDAPVPVHRQVRRTLAELQALGAPVLGQLVLETNG